MPDPSHGPPFLTSPGRATPPCRERLRRRFIICWHREEFNYVRVQCVRELLKYCYCGVSQPPLQFGSRKSGQFPHRPPRKILANAIRLRFLATSACAFMPEGKRLVDLWTMDYRPGICLPPAFQKTYSDGKNMLVPQAILIAIALLASQVCALADTVMILGHGNESCGTWLQNRGSQSYAEAAQLSWVLGYVTAFNNYAEHQSGNISAGTDSDGLFSWIDAYCRANPLDTLLRASGALIRELERRGRH